MRRVCAVSLVAVLALVSGCSGSREAPFEPTPQPAQPFLNCANVVTINLGQTVNGALTSGDCTLEDDSFVDFYELRLNSARTVTITLNSSAFDAFLLVFERSSTFPSAWDDDSGSGTNARLQIQLQAGTYIIAANSFHSGETGAYQLTVN
jgi:hypothetical protein